VQQFVGGAVPVLIALGLLVFVVWTAGAARTFGTLERLNLWQAVVLVATSFGVSLCTALAWQAILAPIGHVVSVWLLFRLTMIAFAAGWIIPSGFIAGVPLAAWLLRRRGVPFARGLASFGIGRFLEITAYCAILPVMFTTAIGSTRLVRAVVLGTVGGLALVYLDLFRGWQVTRTVLRAARRTLPPSATRPLGAAIDFCADVAAFFQDGLGPVVLATVYSFAAVGVALLRAFLTSGFLGLHLSTAEVVVMFAITMFLMAVPFLPGAVGAFEAGIAGAFELVGRSRADGLAYALTVHAAEFAVVIAGLGVLAHLGVSFTPRLSASARGSRSPATAPRPGGR
jgi:glycosyltransferase 2 family protein